jgi:hypothetical protein
MNDTKNAWHPSVESIMRYFESRLDEAEEAKIEQHLADCDACTELGRRACQFDKVWQEWTAETQGDAVRSQRDLHRQQLAIALKRAERNAADMPFVRERLHRWQQELQGKAAAALRVVLNVPDEVTRIVTEGIDALVPAEPQWRFAYARGAQYARGTGSQEEDYSVAVADGATGITVAVDKDAREILVQLRPDDPNAALPLVLLVPEAGGVPIVSPKPVFNPALQIHEIRFRDMDPGKYTIAFEPAG